MGLDIHIQTDIPSLYTEYLHSGGTIDSYIHLKGLSRTFCELMCRRHAISGEHELDQIGRIVGVDISPLYEMETHKDENSDEIDFLLGRATDDTERQEILATIRRDNEALKGNISKVLPTVKTLITKLTTIDNLPGLLTSNRPNSFQFEVYFTDFSIDKGDGYIGNNFGQDLRIFEGFLDYAVQKGSTSVYFDYG
jgi:hypothetical protein